MAKQINRDYNSVVNVKAGIKYHIDNALELRGGFTSYPGKSNRFSADRNIFSIGLGIPVSRDISIDISSQYSRWNDRSIIYEYFDSEAGQVRNETITEDLTQLNILIGLKFKF
jgi:opacity protein-like surface antigen